ncbi:MAG: histone deacetylase family protein, partial [bacterium]|nr:histone deacetylase family protein [bacterium]
MRLLHITDDLFERHSNGAGHPERPERLGAVTAGVQSALGIEVIEAGSPPVDRKDL